MAESVLSDFCLLWYLTELRKEEFWKFKELLKQEPLKFKLKPIPWAELKKASKEDLATLLDVHYSGKQAWDIALSLFLQVNRRDLWTKATDEIRNKRNPYKSHMKEKFRALWEKETCLPVSDGFHADSTRLEYERLRAAYAAEQAEGHAVSMVLQGPEGMGKTTLLRRVMLAWAEGNLWKGRFTFVFFLNCCELNSLPETSLQELLSRDWPDSSEPVGDIFSQPEKILFIVDGLEELKFNLDVDRLSDDWGRRQPTGIVLSSLLQKRMLPNSSLLVAFGVAGLRKFFYLLWHPMYVTLSGFSEHTRKLYFSHFFQEKNKASRAFGWLRDNRSLFVMCQYPLGCWLVCTCLREQLERGEELGMDAKTNTSFHASFFANMFTSGRGNWSTRQSRARLRCLCALAAEGIWTGTLVFQPRDLRRNGVTENDVSAWVDMRLLRRNGDRLTFPHASLQEFCAALWYLLRQPQERAHATIGSVIQLVTATVTQAPPYMLQMGIFLFGFSTERVTSLLETAFGFAVCKDIKREITECLRDLSRQDSDSDELEIGFQELFNSIFENQEKEFTTQVMNFFQDVDVHINHSDDLIVFSFCLKHAQNVQKLRLCVENVFSDDYTSMLDYTQRLSYWRDLCSVFTTSRNLETLDLDNCSLDEASEAILWKMLAQPTCRLQKLIYNFASDLGRRVDFFKAIIHNPHLRYLNLHGTNLSYEEVGQLSEALRHPMCSIQELMLGRCDITDEACEEIAMALVCNQKVKLLSLIENPVMNSGALLLSEVLKRPHCTLESLLLTYCCLTSDACDYIAQALMRSTSLCLLDLGSNFLEDSGVKFLCEALRQPSCNLQQLWLEGCYLTPACCEDLSTVLISNEKLKTLKLGDNKIQDAGVKQLCEALKHPNCKLENLGLEICELTSACCEDLASALTVCKSLRGLNLEWNSLGHDGMVVLCEALSHQDCALRLLGLDKSAFEEETQCLLNAVEENNPQLTIVHGPWERDELRMKGVLI